MSTNAQHHRYFFDVLFLILFFLLLPEVSNSQSLLEGIGIEFGGGYNQLFWEGSVEILTPGGTNVDRTDFYFTSMIRLNYHIDVGTAFTIIPFVGYNQLGGSLENGKYVFHVIELGSFALINVSNLAIGIGGKVNSQLKAQYRYSSIDEDRSDWFIKQSIDAGLRISYLVNPISLSTEAWFGLSNIASQNGPIPENFVIIHQNHFRVLIGYTF